MAQFDFNSIASVYDNWYNTEFGKIADKIEKNAIKKYLSKISSKTILEIGAGTGHWTKFFSENGFFVLGIDTSEKLIEVARNKKIPFATFLNGDVLNLPYNTATIENIVAFTTLEFVQDKNKAFDEIFRVLKKGGTLLIGALNANGSLADLRKNDELYKYSSNFTYASLYERLKVFGKAEIEGCALFPDGKDNLNLAEEKEMNASVDLLNEKGNFLIGFVTKN